MAFNGRLAKTLELHKFGDVTGALSCITGNPVKEGDNVMKFYTESIRNGAQPLQVYSFLHPK